ncbi:MAG TPA: phosphoribosylamine--glycine ligase [Bacillales bacterium]|nr:phosphoribosylamine--glycine ligase [Bacillales bacterium]
MRVLVVGGGGREHAIVWKLAQSERVKKMYAAPGNDGMSGLAECIDIGENDHDKLIEFVERESIGLTVIGPEQPLAEGIVNKFEEAGLPVFGPTKEAALIESSKSFAKDLMEKYGVPTAKSRTFTSFEEARTYVEQQGAPIVIKADGLAAGKGVIVAGTVEEAVAGLEEMMQERKFSGAGQKVVVEEFLEGQEFSLMAFVRGEKVYPMTLSQDHKPAFDGDKGPNTGGMGAYSPVPQLPEDATEQAARTILQPVAQALVEENRSFTGILYAGLIQTAEGPKVIEFNARFGDPETQVVLPRLNNDLADVIMSLLNEEEMTLNWSADEVVGVVLASGGYPGSYEKGVPIDGLEALDENTLVFHAGTKLENGKWLTKGGRILLLARISDRLEEAQHQVYKELQHLSCDQAFFRSDIANKAIK